MLDKKANNKRLMSTTGRDISSRAVTLFNAMTQTAPVTGLFTRITNTENLNTQVGLYYTNYGVENYTDPVFSDPYTDYGGLGN